MLLEEGLELLKREKKSLGKKIYEYTKSNPKPLSTLNEVLNINNIKPNRVMLMTYELQEAEKYYLKPENISILKNWGEVEIYGYEENLKEKRINNITLIPTKAHTTKHYNLIYSDDGVFLYFEPCHLKDNDFCIDFEKEEDDELKKIFAPTLYKINDEIEKNVLKKFNVLLNG